MSGWVWVLIIIAILVVVGFIVLRGGKGKGKKKGSPERIPLVPLNPDGTPVNPVNPIVPVTPPASYPASPSTLYIRQIDQAFDQATPSCFLTYDDPADPKLRRIAIPDSSGSGWQVANFPNPSGWQRSVELTVRGSDELPVRYTINNGVINTPGYLVGSTMTYLDQSVVRVAYARSEPCPRTPSL